MASAVPSLPKNLISDGAFESTTNIDETHSLKISLVVNRVKNDTWEVSGFVDFVDTAKDKHLVHKYKFTLEKGDDKQIGAWSEIFEKEGVTQNFGGTIDPEVLGKFGNEAILSLHAYANGVKFSEKAK